MAKAIETSPTVTIKPPNMQVAMFLIRGTAPYVQNKFSAKAREQMIKKQEAGGTKKKETNREKKDFQKCYEDAMHKSPEGKMGIPAPAFRNALVSACRICGFKMTHAKLAVFVLADGIDETDNTPLVYITKGEPRRFDAAVRNETGVCDIRPRPMWDIGWEAELKVRFDGDMFTLQDVANLLLRDGSR